MRTLTHKVVILVEITIRKTDFHAVKLPHVDRFLFELDGETAGFLVKVQLIRLLFFVVPSVVLRGEEVSHRFLLALRAFRRTNFFEDAQSLHHLKFRQLFNLLLDCSMNILVLR